MKKVMKKLSVMLLSLCLLAALLPINIIEVLAADNEQSSYMQYWTNIQGAAYNINGKVDGNDNWLMTEYSNTYNTRLVAGELYCDLSQMENGIEKMVMDGQFGITQTLSLVNNGRYVKIQYKIRNASEVTQTFSLGSHADVKIGNDDHASITKFEDGSGFYMTGTSPNAQFNFIGKNAYGVTNVDTFWFGNYSYRQSNLFNQVEAESLTGVDSGMAFSWKDRSIQPNEIQTFSVLIGVGEVNKAPVLTVSSPAETFGKLLRGATSSFSGIVTDEENTPNTEVYYAIDNGEPIKAFTFNDSPGNFTASISVPNDITAGSHTVSFFAQDSDGAISSVVDRTFEVVESYTVTFNSNGGSTVNPITNVLANSTITAPTVPTKAGYTFGGWYTDQQLTSAWDFTNGKITANITLYAKWAAQSVTPVSVVPATGDTAPIVLSVSLLLSALAVLFICNRKLRNN